MANESINPSSNAASHRRPVANGGHIPPITEEEEEEEVEPPDYNSDAGGGQSPSQGPVPDSHSSPVSDTGVSSSSPPVSSGGDDRRNSSSQKAARRSSKDIADLPNTPAATKEPTPPPLDEQKSVDPPSDISAPLITVRSDSLRSGASTSPRNSHPTTDINSPRSVPNKSPRTAAVAVVDDILDPTSSSPSSLAPAEEVDDPTVSLLAKSSAEEDVNESSSARRGSTASSKARRNSSRKRGSRKGDSSEQEPLLSAAVDTRLSPSSSPHNVVLPQQGVHTCVCVFFIVLLYCINFVANHIL